DGQSAKLLGLLKERVLDRHLGDVGERHLVAPLDRRGRHRRQGHSLADRRDTLGERIWRKRETVEPDGRVSDAAPLRKLERVAKLEGDQASPNQRKGL